MMQDSYFVQRPLLVGLVRLSCLSFVDYVTVVDVSGRGLVCPI